LLVFVAECLWLVAHIPQVRSAAGSSLCAENLSQWQGASIAGIAFASIRSAGGNNREMVRSFTAVVSDRGRAAGNLRPGSYVNRRNLVVATSVRGDRNVARRFLWYVSACMGT
jgi:hypothetical protein